MTTAAQLIDFAPIATPSRGRGKSLARRKWQQGRVFQKNRRRSDPWLPEATAYVQFWRDVPGQAEAKREFVALGLCRTRTIAERRAAEKLEQLGINSTQTFIEATSTITFKLQGEVWLRSLAQRKRNPLEQTTIDTRRYALDKWIYPFFEGRRLADVNNRAMKELVEHIGRPWHPRRSATTPTSLRASLRRQSTRMAKNCFRETGMKSISTLQSSRIRISQALTLEEWSKSFIVLKGSIGFSTRFLRAAARCAPARLLVWTLVKHISPIAERCTICQKAKRGNSNHSSRPSREAKNRSLPRHSRRCFETSSATRTSGLLFQTSTGRSTPSSQHPPRQSPSHSCRPGARQGRVQHLPSFPDHASREVGLPRCAKTLLVRPRTETCLRALHEASGRTPISFGVG